MTKRQFHLPATLALIASIFMWGTVALFLRSFIHEIDGWVANGFRYGLAAVLWSIPLMIFYRRGDVDSRVFRYAIVPTVINLFAQTFWAWTVYFLEPGMVMFLNRLSLLFTILASFALFSDELALIRSPYFWSGLLLLVIGFIGFNWMGGSWESNGNWTGLLIVIGNSLFIGLYGVSVRYWMRGIRPWISFPVICIYTASGLVLMMFLFGQPSDLLLMKPHRLGLLILSALIGIALGHVCYYYAIEHLGASISAGCQLLGPFITVIGSYYIFHEVFTLGQWLFGLGLLGGAGLLLLAQQHLGKPGPAMPTTLVPEIEEFTITREKNDSD